MGSQTRTHQKNGSTVMLIMCKFYFSEKNKVILIKNFRVKKEEDIKEEIKKEEKKEADDDNSKKVGR
jgi:hypothetical protein